MADFHHTGYALLFAGLVLAVGCKWANNLGPSLIRDVCGIFALLCGIGAYGALPM